MKRTARETGLARGGYEKVRERMDAHRWYFCAAANRFSLTPVCLRSGGEVGTQMAARSSHLSPKQFLRQFPDANGSLPIPIMHLPYTIYSGLHAISATILAPCTLTSPREDSQAGLSRHHKAGINRPQVLLDFGEFEEPLQPITSPYGPMKCHSSMNCELCLSAAAAAAVLSFLMYMAIFSYHDEEQGITKPITSPYGPMECDLERGVYLSAAAAAAALRLLMNMSTLSYHEEQDSSRNYYSSERHLLMREHRATLDYYIAVLSVGNYKHLVNVVGC
eukprot:SM000361S13806  [mRNA]  locus=s361:51224:54724:+ [translate_table: standard]